MQDFVQVLMANADDTFDIEPSDSFKGCTPRDPQSPVTTLSWMEANSAGSVPFRRKSSVSFGGKPTLPSSSVTPFSHTSDTEVPSLGFQQVPSLASPEIIVKSLRGLRRISFGYHSTEDSIVVPGRVGDTEVTHQSPSRPGSKDSFSKSSSSEFSTSGSAETTKILEGAALMIQNSCGDSQSQGVVCNDPRFSTYVESMGEDSVKTMDDASEKIPPSSADSQSQLSILRSRMSNYHNHNCITAAPCTSDTPSLVSKSTLSKTPPPAGPPHFLLEEDKLSENLSEESV
jgi:hypothetical protein